MSEYLVVIEHEGESCGAYCPDLPGVGVVGDSQDEVKKLIRDAVSFHLEGLRQAGEPIPQPTAVSTTVVEVPAALKEGSHNAVSASGRKTAAQRHK